MSIEAKTNAVLFNDCHQTSHAVVAKLTIDSVARQTITIRCKNSDNAEADIAFTVSNQKSLSSPITPKWHAEKISPCTRLQINTEITKSMTTQICTLAENTQKLHKAVNGGDLPQVLNILSHDCNFDAVNSKGKSALLIAVEAGHRHIALELAKCPMSKKTANSVFVFAARKGDILLTAVLLDKKIVDIDTVDNEHCTALMRALNCNRTILSMKLLKAGANPNLVPPSAIRPWPTLSSAVKFNNELLIRELHKKNADLNALDDEGFTPLLIAIKISKGQAATVLIELGANVNLADANGNTPLMLASQRGLKATCKYLISKGADVNLKNTVLDTALHIATRESNTQITLLILQYKPQLSLNIKGESPLGAAIKSRNFQCVYALIRYGVINKDPNFLVHTCSGEQSPLAFAEKCSSHTIQCFIYYCSSNWNGFLNGEQNFFEDNLVKIRLEQESGLTRLKSQINELKGIDELTQNNNTLLCEAAMANCHSNMRYLLTNKAAPDALNGLGVPPIIYAASEGYYPIVQILLEAGAKPDICNGGHGKENWTALHYAAKKNHAMTTRCLLKSEAKTNALNCNGHTPLMCAIKSRAETSSYILCKHEIEIDRAKVATTSHISNLQIKDTDGNNLLMLACASGLETIVSELLSTKQFNVNDKNVKGESALYIAVNASKVSAASQQQVSSNAILGTKHAAIVFTLLESGAELISSSKRSVLTAAIYNENILIALMLIEHAIKIKNYAIITDNDPSGNSPLALSKTLSKKQISLKRISQKLEAAIALTQPTDDFVDLTKDYETLTVNRRSDSDDDDLFKL